MAEVTKENLEQKYNILLAKREELVVAINRIDGALEAVTNLYNEIEDGIHGTKEGPEPSREVQRSDQEPDSKKKGSK